jgi:hypothetical protein
MHAAVAEQVYQAAYYNESNKCVYHAIGMSYGFGEQYHNKKVLISWANWQH